MLLTTLAAALFGGLLSVVHSSPIARDNDGARPIAWQDPEGGYLCWTVQGALTAGSTIGVAQCDNSQAQSFVYNDGSTSIRVSGTDLCVEFGPGLGRNGTPLRVQTCRANGAPGQRLVVTGDAHVALLNGPGQCADVRNSEEPIQSWRCVGDNTNQIFLFEAPPSPLPVGLGILRSASFPSCVNSLRRERELVYIDFDCDPAGVYSSQLNFTADGAPVVQDDAGTVFRLAAFDGLPGSVVRLSSTPPEGQVVSLEPVTDDDTFRVVLLTSGDGGGQFCLTGGNRGLGFWELCDPSEQEQASPAILSNPDFVANLPFLQYFTVELLENRLSK